MIRQNVLRTRLDIGGTLLLTFVGVATGACHASPGGETSEAIDASTGEPADGATDARHAARDARSEFIDARRATPVKDCSAGLYSGAFTCMINNLLPWNGQMTFALVEQVEGAGEFTMLEIVPGTMIDGDEQTYGGHFTASLSGQFDCQTGELTGMMEDGMYATPLLLAGTPVRLAGGLSGSYGGDGGEPEFTGVMGPLTSPDFAALGMLMPQAMCTWSAARVGDVPEDGGFTRDAN